MNHSSLVSKSPSPHFPPVSDSFVDHWLSTPLQEFETFYGYISSATDALILLDACRRGLMHTLKERPRRPLTATSTNPNDMVVRSGTVVVFEEAGTRMKRWRDGLKWTPSRIKGAFLIYRELETAPNVTCSTTIVSLPPDYTPGVDPPYSAALTGTSIVREGGLIKKTFAATLHDSKYHIISYYTREDVLEGRLSTPTRWAALRGITFCETAWEGVKMTGGWNVDGKRTARKAKFITTSVGRPVERPTSKPGQSPAVAGRTHSAPVPLVTSEAQNDVDLESSSSVSSSRKNAASRHSRSTESGSLDDQELQFLPLQTSTTTQLGTNGMQWGHRPNTSANADWYITNLLALPHTTTPVLPPLDCNMSATSQSDPYPLLTSCAPLPVTTPPNRSLSYHMDTFDALLASLDDPPPTVSPLPPATRVVSTNPADFIPLSPDGTETMLGMWFGQNTPVSHAGTPWYTTDTSSFVATAMDSSNQGVNFKQLNGQYDIPELRSGREEATRRQEQHPIRCTITQRPLQHGKMPSVLNN